MVQKLEGFGFRMRKKRNTYSQNNIDTNPDTNTTTNAGTDTYTGINTDTNINTHPLLKPPNQKRKQVPNQLINKEGGLLYYCEVDITSNMVIILSCS